MINPKTNFQKTTARLPGAKLLLFFTLLLLIGGAVIWPSRSGAIRTTPQSSARKRQRPEFVPGQALLRFKPGRAFEGSVNVTVGRKELSAAPIDGAQQVLVEVDRFEGSDLIDGLRIARMAPGETLNTVAALNARDDVLYAEPNYIRRPDVTPNDPSFSSLYAMPLIGAPQAWDITQGDRNVVVAVIDEGIDPSHQDLQQNIWVNPSPGSIPGISGDINGYNFFDNNGTLFSGDSGEFHATHVAGTIGAVGDNAQGVVGVNWRTSLMSLKFIGKVTTPVTRYEGSDADAIRSYAYAKKMRDLWISSHGTNGANVRVVNASFSGGGALQASSDAISALGQSGILFVAAAGNVDSFAPQANNDIEPVYPASHDLPNEIAVAATDQNDRLASFSHYGKHTVQIGAPGVGILSAFPNNNYSSLNGTSMATPQVAGAAALLLAKYPDLTATQLRSLLIYNGDLVAALSDTTITGRRLNIFKSFQAVAENDTTPPGSPANFQIKSQAGRSMNLSWIASGDDGAIGQASLYDISFIDGSSNAVVPLTSFAPANAGIAQAKTVNIPYRHSSGTIRMREFDNVGNEGPPVTLPITIPANFADPYQMALNANAPLTTGGTPIGLTQDDAYYNNYPLPFDFSFFGQKYRAINVSTNGVLYFSQRVDSDSTSAINDLSNYKMIAGMWDDLDLSTSRRADADVYVVQSPGSIIFRWQGVQFGDGTNGDQINFEIELRSDGSIITRYGSGNTNLQPVVGISGGEPDPYVMDQLTSELSPKTLTNAQSATFAPRTTVQLTSSGYTVTEGAGHANITLTRTGDVTNASSVNFATSDSAGSQNCSTANGKASSRCDYVSTFGVAQFAAGESAKTVTIPIVDDALLEGNETFDIAISNGFGTNIGSQTTATVTINDNDSANGPNPLSDNSFFVRQHYMDFLNREPDAPGLAFWTDQTTNCGAADPLVCRINVSGAFFLSIEFQQTGYLIEKIYKAAFGDGTGSSGLGGTHNLRVPIIRLNQFLPDTQRIGQSVIVNQGNWQQHLEDNKNAFTEEFVQRPTFLAAFPLSMTAVDFVNKLNDNAKDNSNVKPLSQAERDALVSGLNNGTMTRGQVLRAVAEDADLDRSEKSRAFVLMQYYGYLRRNPNDPQDTDYTGYDFWLSKLNAANGDYIAAEMVKAFLASTEYNRRFAP